MSYHTSDLNITSGEKQSYAWIMKNPEEWLNKKVRLPNYNNCIGLVVEYTEEYGYFVEVIEYFVSEDPAIAKRDALFAAMVGPSQSLVFRTDNEFEEVV